DAGAVDQKTETTAMQYFALQDRGWPSSPKPDTSRPLFIDDVALTYLQHTGLFETVLNTFSEVWVGARTQDEVSTVLEHNKHVGEVLAIIDDIRNAIREANSVGKIIFGPQRTIQDEYQQRDTSTLHLYSDFVSADAVVFDDRAINKELYAQDQKGLRVP